MIRAPEHVRVAHMTVPKKISTYQVNTTLVKYAIGLTKNALKVGFRCSN